MLKRIEGLPHNVVAVEASGKVTADDYEQILEPAIDHGLRTQAKIRFLYHLGPEFTGFTPGALWDDAKVGLRHRGDFERCAVVTDVTWVRDAVSLFRALMPCPVRVFQNNQLADARTWVTA